MFRRSGQLCFTGHARITAVDQRGRSFVSDVSEGDLWLFPPGVPHSIQGLGPDGCQFLLVFNDGNFDEFETFMITDWVTHTPKDVLAKNFNVPASTFDKVPKRAPYIFQTGLPGDLKLEQNQAAQVTGVVPRSFARTGAVESSLCKLSGPTGDAWSLRRSVARVMPARETDLACPRPSK
jgi:oxalate decarboxylase